MRMLLKHVLNAAFAALFLCSCVDDHGQEGHVTKHKFSVSFAEGDLADSLGLVLNDDLAVSGGIEPLKIRKGKAEGMVAEAEEYYAAYPAEAFLYFSPDEPSSVTMRLPVVQTAVKGSIPEGTDLAVASTSSDEMSFEFGDMLSYIRFSITEQAGKLRSISLISTYGARISGDFAVSCLDEDREVFPMPSSASNVSLTPSGEYFEPGEYYVAVFPEANRGELYVLFENESGELAVKSFSAMDDTAYGRIRDIGDFRFLDYRHEDFFPYSSTFRSVQGIGARSEVFFFTGHEFDVRVIRGEDWLRIVRTRSLEMHSFQYEADANDGGARYGEIAVESLDGSVRLVYTVYQQPAVKSQSGDIREALIDLYNSTDGDRWTRNDNWCSDLPLSEWYGIMTNKEAGISEDDGVFRIDLSNNNLAGTLPSSIGSLSGVRIGISLSSNHISGTLPKEAFRLETLDLGNNEIDAIEAPDDPSGIMAIHIYLHNNRISGPLPEYLGYAPVLRNLRLENNCFTGQIPSSYSRLIASNAVLHLNGNELSGRIPDDILDKPGFATVWPQIFWQNGEGFDLSGVRLRAPVTYYVRNYETRYIEGPYYAADVYSENKYTVLYDGWTESDLNQDLLAWYDAFHDAGLEVISRASKYDAGLNELGLEWIHVYDFRYIHGSYLQMPFYPNMALVDREGFYVVDPITGTPEEIFALLKDEFGELPSPVPPPGPEPEPLPEPVASVLQEASEGSGIDVVLMGDAFSVQEINDGTYESVMEDVMEYFFDVEPFRSYRHLFNVHMITVASGQSGYADGTDTPLQCRYGDGNSITGSDDAAFRYARMAVPEGRMDETLVIVVLNSDTFGGSCYMYPPDKGDSANGRAVTYIPAVDMKLHLRGLVQHEACGHGFAKLADEYFEPSASGISSEMKLKMEEDEKYGWWSNVDFTDDPSEVKWAHFLSDPRYEDENLGVFEGARGCSTGIWRASYQSIMKDNSGEFNAPSREVIWRRIHRLAYGDAWEYSYEAFAEYDRINRKSEEW